MRHFDVLILGAGIAGTLLAAILARHGVTTLVLERGAHPRFAIGESTVPETTFLFEVLAKRYDVPEIGHLRNFHSVRRHISSACGIKRGFSYVYHREGERHRGRESTQFPTWGPPFGPDLHLFRQDIDAYLLAVAARYGAVIRQQEGCDAIDFEPSYVRVTTSRGSVAAADYLVDATGHASPIVEKFGLREEPCSLKTRSRSIFTHMVGVAPYEETGPSRAEHGLPYDFSQGTLHHLFSGGWFWVIPFDNHKTSTNPLASVGLTLDLGRYPMAGASAEEEFRAFAAKFPSIEEHLRNARAVRPWVRTGRLQALSTAGQGDRFFLMPHAMGFSDPLFSSGLSLTASVVSGLAGRLIEAKRSGDYGQERFAEVERWMRKGLLHHDRLVAASYVAMRDFDLWNAWHRVWMLGSTLGAMGNVAIVSRYDRDGDRRHFDDFDKPGHRGTQSIDIPEMRALFEKAEAEVVLFGEGSLSAEAAAGRIYEHLGASGLCPTHWKLTDPQTRCPTTFTWLPLARLAAWGYFSGPPSLRPSFDLRGRIGPLVSALSRDVGEEARRSGRLLFGIVRDALKS